MANPGIIEAARPTAFIQVDVDGLWAVRRCYGVREGDTFADDPCWSEGVAGLLDLFREAAVPASFFLVGRDMLVREKRALARRIASRGHEIGNHSLRHRIGLTQEGFGEILTDLRRTDRILRRAGLPGPVGFRSPGYDVDSRVLRALRRLGYRYDASLLPTPLVPALRLADAWLARKWQPGKRQFGRVSYAVAPRGPYFPNPYRLRKRANSLARAGLIEIPVGTVTGLGLPLTGSAIFALGPDRVIVELERQRASRVPVLLLLHAIDMVDCTAPIVFGNRTPGVGGFDLSQAEKRAMIRPVLDYLVESRRVVLARDWAGQYFNT